MTLEAEPVAVTLRVVTELDKLGVDYLVGGSMASSVHGRPRTTQDVDIVARLAGSHVAPLVAGLARQGGATRSTLFTGIENVGAIRAYTALGYEAIGEFGLLLFR